MIYPLLHDIKVKSWKPIFLWKGGGGSKVMKSLISTQFEILQDDFSQ